MVMNIKYFFYQASLILFISTFFCYSQKNAIPDTVLLNNLISESRRNYYLNQDSSYYYADKALKLSSKLSYPKYISIANHIIGRYYENKEDFGKATNYILTALKIEEQRKDEKRIADLYGELGNIYSYMEKFPIAMQYYQNALSIYQKRKYTTGIANLLNQIGLLHLSREYCETRTKEQTTNDIKTARSYFEKSKEQYENIRNDEGIAICNENLGLCYSKLKQPEIALRFLLNALNYYRKTGNWSGIIAAYDNLGSAYNLLKQYNKSIEYFKQCIHESQQRNFTSGIQFIYERLAQVYDNAHDYKNARDYYVKYMIVRDSIYNAEKSKQVFELEEKYRSEKKEKEILALTLEEKNRGLYIYILSSIIILLSLAGFFLVLRTRSKRLIAEQAIELKEQKIKEMEKERLLLATQSVLEGEEAERQRMARDLHDGLGGLLSGVKLSLNNMKGNTILSNESVNDFDHALGLLDSSINELRRVAHNMMPEVLVHLGLKDALSDFCENLNESNSMNIRFQFIGQFERVEQKLEIGTYRILQELINNAIKHSEAGELIVQMIQEPNRLCLIVVDDGKGFDVNSVNQGKGIGLSSVKSRIESLNGRIDIYSEPGKGTEFIIEFDI